MQQVLLEKFLQMEEAFRPHRGLFTTTTTELLHERCGLPVLIPQSLGTGGAPGLLMVRRSCTHCPACVVAAVRSESGGYSVKLLKSRRRKHTSASHYGTVQKHEWQAGDIMLSAK